MTTSNTNNTKTQYTFEELNDSQRMNLADAYTRKHFFTRQNEMIEFVLNSDQCEGVPFGYDDVTNYEYGYIQEEPQPIEFYEFFIVDEYTCQLLNDIGECIIPDFNIWCRQTSGQCITLDHCIQKIAFVHFAEYYTECITIEKLSEVC